MKKFTVLGWAILLATVPAVRGQDAMLLNDQEIQHRLTGTWFSSWGRGLTTTNIIAADGSFVSQTVGFTNGVTEGYHGTFLATNGIVAGKAMIGSQTVNLRLHISDWTAMNWSGATKQEPTRRHSIRQEDDAPRRPGGQKSEDRGLGMGCGRALRLGIASGQLVGHAFQNQTALQS